MENLNRISSFIFFCLCLLVSTSSQATKTLYVQNSFVHLQDFIAENSSYSKTLVCGTPVKLIQEQGKNIKVQFDKTIGYIPTESVSIIPTQCFQEKYPKFFQSLNIDNADLFYWGKLK